MYVLAAQRAEQAGSNVEVTGSDSTLADAVSRAPLYTGARTLRRLTRQSLAFLIEVMGAEACRGDRLAVTNAVSRPYDQRRNSGFSITTKSAFRRTDASRGVCDLWARQIGDYEEWGEGAGSSRFRQTNWMRPFCRT